MFKIVEIYYSFFIILLLKKSFVKCQQDLSLTGNIQNLSTAEDQTRFLKFDYGQDLNSDDLQVIKVRKARYAAINGESSGSGEDSLSILDLTIGQEDFTT